MAFERSVKMPNEQVCSWHEVTGITQLVDTSTWIEVASWETKDAHDEGRVSVHTSILQPFTDGLTVSEAEVIAKDAPEFTEYTDPTEALIDEIIAKVGDDAAAILFDEWVTDHIYKFNDRASYGGTVYRCVQSHTSQADYAPDKAHTLWTRIKANPDPSEPEEWVQPLGDFDAYDKGDRVKHNGKIWISTYDGKNVWEPGVFGWDEVAE